MPERDQPDLDRVRDAMREHDARPEEPADKPERGEPRPAGDEPAEPDRRDDDDAGRPPDDGSG